MNELLYNNYKNNKITKKEYQNIINTHIAFFDFVTKNRYLKFSQH